MESVSQELLLSFFLERGGRVRNSELLAAFRHFIQPGQSADTRSNRDLFKSLVNNVAVVKQADGVKYVVLKKRYRDVGLGGGRTARSGSLGSAAHRQGFDGRSPAETLNINNNNQSCSSPVQPMKLLVQGGADAGITPPPTSDSLTPTVLNMSNSGRKTVFAVVAIKSPPLPPSRCEEVILKDPGEDLAARRVPAFGLAAHLCTSLRSKRRQSVTHCSPATQRVTEKAGFDTKDLILLDPREHEWLVKSATGRWGQVSGLLLQDVRLAEKRNFISGFTVLHWAAKKGNSKMMHQILDLSRQGGLEVDVNAKSHDGYTALHIAAIHGHEAVLNLLVRSCGAKCDVRDNSGKKPYHYLGEDMSPAVRGMLGDPRVLHRDAGCGPSDDDQRFSDVPKGFNSLSKLFQPSVGHPQKKKPRHRPSFHFISDEQDENRRDCAAFNRRL